MRSSHSLFFLFLLAVFFLISCGSTKDPEFKSIENPRVSQLGFKESILNLDLIYFNPNKFRVKLKEAEGDAWLDSNYLGHFIVDTLIHIPAFADFRLPVTLKMDMGHFLQNTSALLYSKEVFVKIEGRAKLGKGVIFIHYPIYYEGKQDISQMMK